MYVLTATVRGSLSMSERVGSFKEASETYRLIVDRLGIGAHEISRAYLIDSHEREVAVVSYNGRVWPATGWIPSHHWLYSPIEGYGWKEVPEERYWDLLGALPPETRTHLGFLVGEPMDHNPYGIPLFTACIQIGDKFYESTTPWSVEAFQNLKREQVFG